MLCGEVFPDSLATHVSLLAPLCIMTIAFNRWPARAATARSIVHLPLVSS
jgi:hypothetical protein